jgi:PTS system galactitol-specific IIB component
MVKTKTILVACGAAIATSTAVAKALEEELGQRGIPVTFLKCKASEVSSLAENVDLIVTTTPVDTENGKPVIQTLAFITGIGKQAVIDEIIRKLNE